MTNKQSKEDLSRLEFQGSELDDMDWGMRGINPLGRVERAMAAAFVERGVFIGLEGKPGL